MSAFVLSDQDRKAPVLVTGRDQVPVLHQQKDRHGTFDHLLRFPDTVHDGVALIDQGGYQLGRVDRSVAHCHQLVPVVGKILIYKSLGIIDDAHCRDRIDPEVRAHQQRLRIGIADAADAARTAKIIEVVLEFGPERRVRDRVDLSAEPVLFVPHTHTGISRTEMAVVVRTEKYIQYRLPA